MLNMTRPLRCCPYYIILNNNIFFFYYKKTVIGKSMSIGVLQSLWLLTLISLGHKNLLRWNAMFNIQFSLLFPRCRKKINLNQLSCKYSKQWINLINSFKYFRYYLQFNHNMSSYILVSFPFILHLPFTNNNLSSPRPPCNSCSIGYRTINCIQLLLEVSRAYIKWG